MRRRPAGLTTSRPSAYLDDHRAQAACERNLHIALPCALDIGNHITAGENLQAPHDQADISRILGPTGVLAPGCAEQIAPVAGCRNILIRDYLRIDPAKVYTALTQTLGGIQTFARDIQA